MLHKSESDRVPPQCLFAAEIRLRDGQGCFMHSHACTEIIWFRGCRGWLLQEGQKLRYGDGDIGIYQPGPEHGDACETGGIQMCMGLTGSGAEELPTGVWPADSSTLTALERLRGELGRHDAWRRERMNLLSGCVVMELRRQIADRSGEPSHAPYAVRAARRTFDRRFSEPLTVAGVASELGVGPDYLRQAFVKWVGEPPIHYLIRKRLDAACDLLRLNQEKTADIAARVGIPNPYYFSRLFRQRMGTTPTLYRKRHAGGG